MTGGLWQPRVMLPLAAQEWPPERLRLVLLHELAHIQRGDLLSQWCLYAATALYWFHPLVWWAVRRCRQEQELACDDLVVSTTRQPAQYASELLHFARLSPSSSPAALAMAQPSTLEGRLLAILDEQRDRRALPRYGFLLAAAVIAVVLPLAAMQGTVKTGPEIRGTVYDASNGVVPQAHVVLTNKSNGQTQETTTNAEGQYQFAPLANGQYTLNVLRPGFEPAHISSVMVSADGPTDTPLRHVLRVGSLTETLRVEAPGTPRPVSSDGPRKIRVGGSVQAAKLVYQQRPVYPEEAKTQGVEGIVVLQAVIGLDGRVISVQTLESPDARLTEAAVAAVKQWRYQTTLLNGQPVEVTTQVLVTFRLLP